MNLGAGEIAAITVAGLSLAGNMAQAWVGLRGKRIDTASQEREATWENAAALRNELRQENSDLRAQIVELSAKVDALSAQVHLLTSLACVDAPGCELRKEIGENG